VVWSDPLEVRINDDLTLLSTPAPGSGAVLAFILNILKNYDVRPGDDADPVFYHRMVEAFKWGYGRRTELGDPFDENIAVISLQSQNGKQIKSPKPMFFFLAGLCE